MLLLVFPDRRGRESAARAGIVTLCTDFSGTDNCPDSFQGINKRGLRLYCGFPDIRLLIVTIICLRIFVDIVAAGDKMRRLSTIMRPDMARTDVRAALGDENREPEPAPEAPKGAGERNQLSGCR